jgi:hypothetical protein
MQFEEAEMWARLPKEMQIKILQLQADLQAAPETVDDSSYEEPNNV